VVDQPLILGHESAGIILAVGSSVTALKEGDRVALEPGVPCRTCDFCRGGRYNLCASMQFAATPPVDGTLCSYYTIPEDFAYLLPGNISIAEGALVEPLSIAVHATKLANIATGHKVLVMGAGPIGLLCCAVARSFGASLVVCTDIVEPRLEFARTFAANRTFRMTDASPQENAQDILKDCGLDGGFDVVIDATGAPPCISCGINALCRGGTFVQAGLGMSEINFPIEQICSKEVVFKGSFRYGPGDYKTAIELLRSRKVSVKELITNYYPFSRAEEAFCNVASRNGIKSVIWGPGIELDTSLSNASLEMQLT
jgi:L-iditol 2-dehydrogenase